MGESLILLLGARLYVVCFHYYTFSVFGIDVVLNVFRNGVGRLTFYS